MPRLVTIALLLLAGLSGCAGGLSGQRVTQDQWEPPVAENSP